ncbi:MAG: Zn-dependent exopeptidase M28 [Deltaproteobacteria bacterium]|nr:Zn-dependent exopeptidase M28 [Deltaproteobacteria bacterium]
MPVRNIPRSDLPAAFPEKRAAAEKLGAAIDSLGSGAEKGDGVLQESEIKAAIELARGDRVDGGGTARDHRAAALGLGASRQPVSTAPGGANTVRSLFLEVMGELRSSRLDSAEKFAAEVQTGKATQGITDADLLADLTPLCTDPELSVREAGGPQYIKSAQWVADKLASYGAKPLGDSKDGQRTFLQAFRWEERFVNKVSRSYNVVARFDGQGPEPRDAVLVIAHLDNLSAAEKLDYQRRGRDMSNYQGANDNTSCVAAVLEMAQAIQESGPCRRDVIVLIPSAEEDGLKGTEAFCLAPPVPLDRIIGAVNLEMIGRNATDELLCFGGGRGSEADDNPLYRRAIRLAGEYGTSLKPGHQFDDGEHWWDRSDHRVTANMGIPSIMLHGRATPDSYHTNQDTLDKLNIEKIRVTARHLFRIVRDLANDPAPLEKRKQTQIPSWSTLGGYPGKVWPGAGDDPNV